MNLPKRSSATPVQQLNREGVAELKHGHNNKAKRLFYKAYLLDPDDPFTLNNLGYVAELDGDAQRALRYYALAAQDKTEAMIDVASRPALKGQPVSQVFNLARDADREASQLNEQVIALMEKQRVFEAKALLKSALPKQPENPFLLNNLGYVMESEGDLESALRYYSAAASLHSDARVVVTPREKWRGKPISEVAAGNAREVNEVLAKGEGTEARVARLNLRGVSALNDNDPERARGFFLDAYRLDPQNSFTLNNLGYISELVGDRESAEMYYEAARTGGEANARVSLATRRDAEGQRLHDLAGENQNDVDATLAAIQTVKRREPRPIELKRRDAAPAESQQPVPPIGVKPPALPPLPPPNGTERQNEPQNFNPHE